MGKRSEYTTPGLRCDKEGGFKTRLYGVLKTILNISKAPGDFFIGAFDHPASG
jgi:hypothetical protein